MRGRFIALFVVTFTLAASALGHANAGIARPPRAAVTHGSKKGSRAKNHLRALSEATGAHDVYRRDAKGKLTGYAEFKLNQRSPSGFEMVKRVDTQYANPHTHGMVPTPHVHERSRARPAKADELPR